MLTNLKQVREKKVKLQHINHCLSLWNSQPDTLTLLLMHSFIHSFIRERITESFTFITLLPLSFEQNRLMQKKE